MPQREKNAQIRIREGFRNQRLVILPQNIIQRSKQLSIVENLYVTHIGSFYHAQHHYVDRPTGVEDTILLYCFAGKGTLKLNKESYPVRSGQMVIIPANQAHTYSADTQDPWSLFWVHFSGKLTDSILQTLGMDSQNPIKTVPHTERIRELFENVFICLDYHYTDAALLAMSTELLRLIGYANLNQSKIQHNQPSVKNQVMRSITFMEKHLHLPLSLDALAKQSGLSVPHFCKLFKNLTNQTPLAYFIQLKVQKAGDLLYQTDQTIKSIAAQLGYDDPYYFSRLFKKVQGCSPSQYRRQNSSNQRLT